MSQATTADQSPSPNPIDSAPEAWGRQMWRRAVGLRMLDSLMHQGRLNEQAKLVRRLVRKTQDGTLGQQTPDLPEDTAAAEEDMYQVGDNIHYHYPAPPAPAQSPPPANTPPPPAASRLKTALLLAAAGAAGAGIPAAIEWASTPVQQPPAAVSGADTDTDTQYEIGISQ